MGALWIRALGPLQVIADGVQVPVSSRNLRIVLECLALRANSVVAADFLAEVLWDGHPPAHPGPQLQVYVANLRNLLEPNRRKGVASHRLASRPGGYLLAVEDDELDLLQFRAHLAAGERAVEAGELATGAVRLRQALELFVCPAFPDLADMELLGPDLEEAEEARLDTYQDLFDVELALGRHSNVVWELQRLVSQYPFRERLWASLVLALYRSDRQADALAACRTARKTFAAELGIDPGERLRELEALVLRQDASLGAPAVNEKRRVRQRLDNLPAALTPMVGRDAELGEVCSLYRSEGCRLVTVTGAGGAGKTRLAMAAAARLGERMPDGAGWVNLSPLTRVEQVPGAITAALGLEAPAGEDPLKIASRFLQARRLLLVLDNFEHLEDAWPVVLDLLTAAPELRILTTSRRRLGLRPEHEFELAPLELPPLDPPLPLRRLQEVPAMKLLLNRGRAVRPRFAVDAGNAAVLTRLCHRLDGLPLAIELAAAQLRQLSEHDLVADLEASLAALPAGFRDLPDRQRTLTATMEWSYQLLAAPERLLFVQLGVFANDPATAAIDAVRGPLPPGAPSTEDLLCALADHSLLRRYTDQAGSRRVALLQSIREFARDRLGMLPTESEVRRQHAEHYLALAESLGPELWGGGQVDAFRALHAEALDIRAALLWATGPAGSTDLALRLVGELWHYWELTGSVTEQQRIAVELVEATPDAAPQLRAPALSGAATLTWALGRYDQAAHLHRRALEAFEKSGNSQGIAWTILCLAVQAAQSGDFPTAERLTAEALSCPGVSLRVRIGALVVLSRQAYCAGDHLRALELCRASAELTRRLADRWLLGIVLTNLAESTEQAGDYGGAELLLIEAISASLQLGAEGNLAAFLDSLAGVYTSQNRYDPALRLLAAADSYRTDRGMSLDQAERRRVDAIIDKARAAAGPIRFGLAWAGGRRLTVRQAANEVLRGGRQPRLFGTVGGSARSSSPAVESAADSAPWT
ncbi:putative ATPase/DNA-binding SARP family transcriptional activator [Pseudarthrobacter oxydans]|uniref:ATPase/DNA-binding SARP family transcriptional activator n=1 Tax=Pseudarthrobacter oxydans TaxID=1671 RepID=A0AAW8NGB8_PSEOX|nr:BTAD domain-containing putative transcriptional regulator [Pseudarthrobacter oxydans]MDR6794560.1 putative ATPase/DNA-binding SARP family transcriptional activator [Pseudarthrobacter oxydans]MDR7165954.1 putative ATPase/DNA-binding SARP family transcriptional activator [Pseudarthrobacter oxydans]